MLKFTRVAWGPFSAWNPFSARPTDLQRQAACGSGAEFSFLPTPARARAKEAQEVTHSAATGALLFPVGTSGRSGKELILFLPTQLSETSVQVTRAHTFSSGMYVPKGPELLPLPHSPASGRWDPAEKVSLSCAPRI